MPANKDRTQFNEETLKLATNHKTKWGGDDVDYLMANYEDFDYDTALVLGRTFQSIQNKRRKIQLLKERRLGLVTKRNEQAPITLNEAMAERIKQKANGVPYPTIIQIPGGYVVEEGRLADEVSERSENGTMGTR